MLRSFLKRDEITELNINEAIENKHVEITKVLLKTFM